MTCPVEVGALLCPRCGLKGVLEDPESPSGLRWAGTSLAHYCRLDRKATHQEKL